MLWGRAESIWITMKVNRHLEGFEGGVDEFQRVEFCYNLHCCHLGEAEY